MTSTFEGWQPAVGDRVRYRMFSPQFKWRGDLASQVEEAGGLAEVEPDGTAPIFTVVGVVPDHHPGVTRYCLAEHGRTATNWPDDDYTILWPALDQEAGLW